MLYGGHIQTIEPSTEPFWGSMLNYIFVVTNSVNTCDHLMWDKCISPGSPEKQNKWFIIKIGSGDCVITVIQPKSSDLVAGVSISKKVDIGEKNENLSLIPLFVLTGESTDWIMLPTLMRLIFTQSARSNIIIFKKHPHWHIQK